MSEDLKNKVFEISGESIGLRDRLKEVLPQVFDANEHIDFDMLRDLMGEGDISKHGDRYGLSWCGQSEARRAMSIKTSKTLTPEREKSVDFDTTENILIEGENLDVLRILQKAYYRKVKMIYIDPPYNTGSDSFVYDDDFTETKKEQLQKSGDIDEYGLVNRLNSFRENKKENGQYHSRWLSMMYQRLMLAYSLLTDDGVIFVSIDDNEQANLKLLMDSMFGEDNFVGDIIWNSTKSVTNTALISVSHTYNMVYFKNIDYFVRNRHEFRLPDDGDGFSNPDNDSRGEWKADPFQVEGWRPNQQYEIINPQTGIVYKPNPGCSWKNDNNKFKELVKDNRIVFGKTGEGGPQRKRFIHEAKERGKVAKTIWDDIETTSNGTLTIKKMFDNVSVFSNPKPVSLIRRMMQLATNDSSIILDFFAGSGTTAQAVMELNAEDGGNRRFICVQLPEEVDEDSEAYKAGYTKISDITAERIRRAGAKIREKEDGDLFGGERGVDTGFKYCRLSNSHFKIWNDSGEGSNVGELLLDVVDATLPDSSEEEMLYELILKCGLMLTTRIEDKGEGLYYLPEEGICMVLRRFDDTISEEIDKLEPKIVITIDRLFENDDARVSNMRLMYGERGIRLDII